MKEYYENDKIDLSKYEGWNKEKIELEIAKLEAEALTKKHQIKSEQRSALLARIRACD